MTPIEKRSVRIPYTTGYPYTRRLEPQARVNEHPKKFCGRRQEAVKDHVRGGAVKYTGGQHVEVKKQNLRKKKQSFLTQTPKVDQCVKIIVIHG